MERMEKRIADLQQSHARALRQLDQSQSTAIAGKDSSIKDLELRLEESERSGRGLGAKCQSLQKELEEESGRSTKAIRDLEVSLGSKGSEMASLVETMRKSLESKTQQCNDLRSDLSKLQAERASSENQIEKLKKEVRPSHKISLRSVRSLVECISV